MVDGSDTTKPPKEEPMKIEDVAKLSPTDRFLYWMRERHQIYLRRKVGKPKPWTDDKVLQSYFFTNPYRENDKVTIWFRDNIREPLRDRPQVLFATIAFRWFNYIPTGGILMEPNKMKGEDTRTQIGKLLCSPLCHWNSKEVLKRLQPLADKKQQVFTGAFMINSPGGEPKLGAIIRRIENVWADIRSLTDKSQEWKTLQEAHKDLTQYEGLGGFMAYEVVCDLRYTYLLENATDKLTWCNPGPGASRGLRRIAEEPFEKGNNASSPPLPKDWRERMLKLLKLARSKLRGMPPLEMREIEHSLCEFDKYERARLGDGRLKRTYPGAK